MSECIYDRIYSGEAPASEIYRNEEHGILVFLDAFPASKGHMLVIPKEHVDTYHELSDERATQLQMVAKACMAHVSRVFTPERVGLSISGYGVPHTHIHVVPSYKRGDMQKLFDFERTDVANKLPVSDLEVVRNQLIKGDVLAKEIDAILARQ